MLWAKPWVKALVVVQAMLLLGLAGTIATLYVTFFGLGGGNSISLAGQAEDVGQQQNWVVLGCTDTPNEGVDCDESVQFRRKKMPLFLLAFLVGGLGVDRFYMRYVGWGLLKLFTGGGCGIWVLIDWILVLTDYYSKDGVGCCIWDW